MVTGGAPPRSLGREAREARHTALLDEAAREFNRMGVASASLVEIARRVGLSRGSLYNYCKDREDLAYQTYLRACHLLARSIRTAELVSGSGLHRVETFLKLTLQYDHPPLAVLNEVSFLADDLQREVRKARAGNVAGLGALIQAGIDDGSIRQCHVGLACEAILGVLSWAPLSQTWTQNADETFAIRMASAVPSMILDGLAAEAIPGPTDLQLTDKLNELRTAIERDDRLEDLAKAGSRLFNRRGIDGVSLDDVAAEVGATKGLIYHYFDTKPAFVAFCYSRAFDLFERIMTMAEAEATGLETARLGTALNVMAQLEDVQPLSLGTTYESFSADLRRQFSERTKALTRRSVEIIRRGIRDGTVRNVDMEPIALASAGVFNHLARWLPSNDRPANQATANEISAILLFGLRKRDRG
ncbi:TetR/AcrR family transcriptional regulator [Phenylobacterium sp. LH3H17]|uniref:TetR/AcrR family transcriptional regulator n=1 Tax=Phenylobacterium sp. LH3H17 TaxID=2903901 RepID=UPI0020CA1ED8|nr:TetR/AcrR family transcriptional regulator [Phenylobacterium sp. LH3H17]UTP38202.1 TetR/AcrR family transcriptional regulator [Phenylobacterium sp. LH3H17]